MQALSPLHHHCSTTIYRKNSCEAIQTSCLGSQYHKQGDNSLPEHCPSWCFESGKILLIIKLRIAWLGVLTILRIMCFEQTNQKSSQNLYYCTHTVNNTLKRDHFSISVIRQDLRMLNIGNHNLLWNWKCCHRYSPNVRSYLRSCSFNYPARRKTWQFRKKIIVVVLLWNQEKLHKHAKWFSVEIQ